MMNPKELLIYKLKKTIKEIEKESDNLDVSCLIVQQQDDDYIVDIHEYL